MEFATHYVPIPHIGEGANPALENFSEQLYAPSAAPFL